LKLLQDHKSTNPRKFGTRDSPNNKSKKATNSFPPFWWEEEKANMQTFFLVGEKSFFRVMNLKLPG